MGNAVQVPFADLPAQNASISDELTEAVATVIRDCAFIGGPDIAIFEQAFALFHTTRQCVGVANGTDALEIALEAMMLPPGSEVIVPANTFIATAEAVTRAGLKVVFADVDDTYTLDAASVQRAITANTSALIPVHLYGQPADMAPLIGIAEEHGLRIVEDCSQAHGAEYRGSRVGSLGDVGTFSFYPGKNLAAFGDAGAIVTSDDAIAERCRLIANHGRLTKYDHLIEGRNSRLDTIQAAVLRVKLGYLPRWIERRREIARAYLSSLDSIPGLTLPAVRADSRHVYHLFVVRVENRDSFRAALADAGVETGIHYPHPLPVLPPYAARHLVDAEGSNSLAWSPRIVSLPVHESLTDAQVDHVIEVVRRLDDFSPTDTK